MKYARNILILLLLAQSALADIALPITPARVYNGGQSDMPAIPWSDQTECGRSTFLETDVADALTAPDAEFSPWLTKLATNRVSYYRGIALTGSASSQVFDNWVTSCYVGVKAASSDIEISRNRLFNNRDTHVWIPADSGNVQVIGNHCFGARIQLLNDGGGQMRSMQNTYADGPIGTVSYGYEETYIGDQWQHNTMRDIVCYGHSQSFVNCVCRMAQPVTAFTTIQLPLPGHGTKTWTVSPYSSTERRVGIEAGDRFSWRGGCITLDTFVHPDHVVTGDPSDCIWVANAATGFDLETQMNDGQAINGAVAVRFTGSVYGPYLRIIVNGWHNTNSRILKFDNSAQSKALNIVVIVNGNTGGKAKESYIDIGTGWTGSIIYADTYSGVTTSLTEGAAY